MFNCTNCSVTLTVSLHTQMSPSHITFLPSTIVFSSAPPAFEDVIIKPETRQRVDAILDARSPVVQPTRVCVDCVAYCLELHPLESHSAASPFGIPNSVAYLCMLPYTLYAAN